MSVAIDIVLWLLIGLGALALVIIWAVIIVASVTTILRFIKVYRKTSAELDAEEKGEDEGPTHYF